MTKYDDMPYRRLGRHGLQVSALGLGGWTTYGGSVADASTVERILRRAFDAGVNFFDIADVYAHGASEQAMGAVLRTLPRHELVISSKVFHPMSADPNDRGLSRKHVMESVEKSLRRIGTDYLDVYFCHRFDEGTPLDETARAMDDLVRQGKILHWGTSEWSGAQLRDAHALAERRGWDGPVVEQPQYSLLHRARFESEILPAARETGMGLVVWSPLASGVLTGKYDDGVPAGSRLSRIDWLKERLLQETQREKVRAMKAVADDVGTTRARLALAWALSRPGVSSVIMGATSVAQLDENLASLSVKVTDEVGRRLDSIFA